MSRKTDSLNTGPLFVAVRAVHDAANQSDHTPSTDPSGLDDQAAALLRRAADQIDERPKS